MRAYRYCMIEGKQRLEIDVSWDEFTLIDNDITTALRLGKTRELSAIVLATCRRLLEGEIVDAVAAQFGAQPKDLPLFAPRRDL
jgi:hypothetical protein